MLKLDTSNKTLVRIAPTTLAAANVLERDGLQAAIIESWEAFCEELGYPELFLVGSEVQPHDSCQDRIDLLALSRDGVPVIIELKRDRNKLQLLQAIAYAAMVAKWDTAEFLRRLEGESGDEVEDLRSLLEDDSFGLSAPEIVLVAENFDPEVILAAEWLATYGVDVSAFGLSVVIHQGETLISMEQKFPLAGLDDAYVSRSRRSGSTDGGTTWDEALDSIPLPFAKRAADIFRRHVEGSPARRAFFSIYGKSPLGRLRISFKRHYLRVETVDQSPETEEALRKGLGPEIEITRWGSESTKNAGFAFRLATEAEFDRFLIAVGEKSE